MFHEISQVSRQLRQKPRVSIFEWGYSSENSTPHVSVTVGSRKGTMTVFTYPDDDQGHAQATMNARQLGSILCIPVEDHRKKPEIK